MIFPLKKISGDAIHQSYDPILVELSSAVYRRFNSESNPRVYSEIQRTKRLLSKAAREDNRDMLGVIERLNRELILIVADFKCHKCGSPENLQVHHLIDKRTKPFINNFWRYAAQRHYWANQIILCKDCHCEWHEFSKTSQIYKTMPCITPELIEKIKKKYSYFSVDTSKKEE